MKTMILKSLALSIMLATGTLANAEVINGFINGDASVKPEDDRALLELEIRRSNPVFLSNFTVHLQLNRKDSSLFGILSTLQNTTSLGTWMTETFPVELLVDKPEWYQKHQTAIYDLQDIIDLDQYLEFAVTKGTRLWALTQMEKKSITKTLFLNAMNDVDGHHDFITSSGTFRNKGLGLSVEEYRLLKVGLKKFNAIEKVVNTFETSIDFVGVVSRYEIPSNNLDHDGMRNFVRNNLDAGNMINMFGHSDGAALANYVLDVYGDYDKIRMMSMGTVDSRVWGGGKNITLIEDIYVHLTPFAMSDDGLSNHDNWYDGVGGFIAANAGKYGYFLGHDFSGVYLDGVGSREVIISKYVSNYNILKLADMGCNPDIQSCPNEPEPVTNNYFVTDFTLFSTTAVAGERVGGSLRYDYEGNGVDLPKTIVSYCLSTTRSCNGSSVYLGYNAGRVSGVNLGPDFLSFKKRRSWKIPDSTSPGDYFIVAMPDKKNAVPGETDENDNVALAIRIISAPTTPSESGDWSDITLSNATLSVSSANPGDEIEVSVTQHYAGTLTKNRIAQYPRVGYFFSDDQVLDDSDTFLGYNSSSIGADVRSQNESRTVTVPENVVRRTEPYYILYQGEYLDVMAETDESNNLLANAIIIAPEVEPQWSDITLSDARLKVGSVVAGGRISAYVTQHYAGNINRNDLPDYPRVGYFLSSDDVWDENDIELDSDVSSIGADNRSQDEYDSLIIPANTQVREEPYYILFKGECRDDIPETIESNNMMVVPFVVEEAIQYGNDDLYLSDLVINGDVVLRRGDHININYKVNHSGYSPADYLGRTYISYIIKPVGQNNSWSAGQDIVYVGSDNHQEGESTRINISTGILKGLAMVTITVDPNDRIDETDENNNSLSFFIYIQ